MERGGFDNDDVLLIVGVPLYESEIYKIPRKDVFPRLNLMILLP
jgi:hypothetical protein